MNETTVEKGRAGELVATKYLLSKGFQILARNWRWRKCEIDIVAFKDGLIVFVEVKSRGKNVLESGIDIKPAQRKRIIGAASAYMNTKVQGEVECRFDLIRVRNKGNDWCLDHFIGVFEGASG